MRLQKTIAAVLLLATLIGTVACGDGNGQVTDATTAPPSVITTGKPDTERSPVTEPSTEPEPIVKSLLPRQSAAEGMVLLKNEDQVLPLKQGSTVALFGKGQVELVKGGGGSGDVKTEHIVGVLEGMENKESDGKIAIYSALSKKYKHNSEYTPRKTDIQHAAEQADTAIYIISRHSGEGYDRTASAGDYYLADSEIKMIEDLIAGGFDDIVIILNVGGMVDTTKLLSYPEIKSILLAWQPGQDGGDAIADLLVGDVTPSGKLCDTFAKSYDDYPTSEGFSESRDYVNYTEDVFVGYRYFETFDPTYSKVNFEFGFGLSYTTFEYSNITFTEQDGEMIVSVTVKNTGAYKGKDVVQLYFSAPQGKLGKPAKELCAFAKTSELTPGASETVALRFSIGDLSSYDDTGKVQKSAYVIEAGDYQFYLGNSIKNAGKTGVRYIYTVAETMVVEQLSEQMAAKLLAERLLANGTYENIFSSANIGLCITAALTKIEAEQYYGKHCHASVVFNTTATRCGIQMLTSNEGNRYVTFAVEAPEAGNWRIGLGIGNSNGNIDKAVRFYVNDTVVSGVALPLQNTGGLWAIQETPTVTLSLQNGFNLIRVEFLCGDKFQGVLDYITLEKGEGSFIPNAEQDYSQVGMIKPTGEFKIEGEYYVSKSAEVDIEEIFSGAALGGISIKNLHTPGNYITYELNVEEAGDYRIVMRLANGLDATSNTATATVNGALQSSFHYSIIKTSVDGNEWFNFMDVDAGVITLARGKNTLTFTVLERMGNLDYFTLEKVKSSASRASAGDNETILFEDLLKNPALMDAFIDQLTVEQMVFLLHGHGENVPAGTGTVGGLPEYGIPPADTADGPAGLRLFENTTAWPVQTLLACTWNTQLMNEIGQELAAEATRYNVDIWLAPGVNIHRNPLCGRNFEYYSEDPYLSGTIAAALINGVQGEGIGVMIKHFVCNEKEINRSYSDSRVSERALREIYLRPFEIAVKTANPWAIMSSYNKVNGIETAENYDLLTNILRGEWQYDGVVSSDWWNDSVQYKELLAGQSLKMRSGDEAGLIGAYKSGILTRENIEVHVKRVLELVMKSNAAKRVTEESAIVVDGEKNTVFLSIDSTWKSSEIGMEECKDKDGTYNTTNTYGGQWMVFLIDVKESGKYKVELRVASNDGNDTINFLVDGKVVGHFRNTVRTGDWQVWAKSNGTLTLNLTEGVHQLRLNITGGSFNINTITLIPQ